VSSAQVSRHAAPTGPQEPSDARRESGRTTPGHKGDQDQPDAREAAVAVVVVGEDHGRHRGHEQQLDDRESDRLMKRTSKRPLVTRVVNDWEALVLGWVLSVASVLLFALAVNVLSGVLTAAAPQEDHREQHDGRPLDGPRHRGPGDQHRHAAGDPAPDDVLAGPPLEDDRVEVSMKYSDDYARAGIPMLGAIASDGRVASQVVLYAWATVICCSRNQAPAASVTTA
jgi:protoheme IX farnesyltransferase